MEINVTLLQLPKTLKLFLASILIALLIGVSVGVAYLSQTTHLSPKGTVERFNGNQEKDELEMEVSYSKPMEEMLITTHSHIISFSLIFFLTGLIFYFSRMRDGAVKKFILIEPPLSSVISFGSIWGMRFIHSSFIYLAMLSATLMYLSLYFMIIYSLRDLLTRKEVIPETTRG